MILNDFSYTDSKVFNSFHLYFIDHTVVFKIHLSIQGLAVRVNWFVEGEGKKEKMTRGGVGEKMTRGGMGGRESKEREHREPITLLFRK